MTILSVDSSATAASVALLNAERVIGQFYTHTRLTHSQTLVPMIDSLLKTTETAWMDIDCLAVATGPGSFTGVRIGVATVKGLAYGGEILCAGVSTLEAMAAQLCHMEGKVLCCVMDARREQVYNALYRVEHGALVRLCEDRALSIADLSEELVRHSHEIVLVGDGAQLCYTALCEKIPALLLAPLPLRIQSAVGVGLVALRQAEQGMLVPAARLTPTYLRLPQAERELKQRKEEKA